MKTATMIFKTDPETKLRAQEKAREMGVSLSFLLNQATRKILTEKELVLIPNKTTVRAIKQAERDFKSGKLGKPKKIEDFLLDMRKMRNDL